MEVSTRGSSDLMSFPEMLIRGSGKDMRRIFEKIEHNNYLQNPTPGKRLGRSPLKIGR